MVRIRFMALLALSALFLLASAALAQQGGPQGIAPGAVPGGPGAPAVKVTRTWGTVKSIADDKGSFVLTPAKGDDVTVTVNADTKYRAADADSTFADVVKVGGKVVATLNADGVATVVIVAPARTSKNGPG